MRELNLSCPSIQFDGTNSDALIEFLQSHYPSHFDYSIMQINRNVTIKLTIVNHGDFNPLTNVYLNKGDYLVFILHELKMFQEECIDKYFKR
jgi:hypothetical protein